MAVWINRASSLVLSFICLVVQVHGAGFGSGRGGLVGAWFVAVLISCFPSVLIWFSDEIGEMTGGNVTQTTPGCLVAASGWFFFLLYAGLYLYDSGVR